MKKGKMRVPLAMLPAEASEVGKTVPLSVTVKVISLEGDQAVVELETVNGAAPDGEVPEGAPDAETMRRLAKAADDESWSD